MAKPCPMAKRESKIVGFPDSTSELDLSAAERARNDNVLSQN
jgi:hypothetical protein